MNSVFVFEMFFFGIFEVESKTPDNIWSITGRASTEIEVGAEFICNPAHYGDSSKNFTVKKIFAYGKSLKSLPYGWGGLLHAQGPEDVNLEDGGILYPRIPGIEKLSDDFWKVHGKTTNYEIKLGDLVFFGTLVEKDRDLIIDNLKPDVILVVEDILVDGEHTATIAPRQEGFLILKGGDVQNIEDADLLCW